MMTVISGLFLAWYLSGFEQSKVIRRKRNRWHAWGAFDQIWGFINGDLERLLPDSMPWPFKKIFFTLTYSQYVEDTNDEDMKKKIWIEHVGASAEGKKILYHQVQKYHGIKRPMRLITEEVTRIRKNEIHPFVITVQLPNSGFTFYFVFTATIGIENPMDILKLDNFLSYFGTELNDAVVPWAVSMEKVWTKGKRKNQTKNIVLEKMLGLRIDDKTSITVPIKDGLVVKSDNKDKGTLEMPMKDFLNEERIGKYGMVLKEFSLDIGYDDNVKNILDTQNKQIQEVATRGIVEEEKLTNVIRNEIKNDNADQKRLKEKQRLEEVLIPSWNAEAEAKKKAITPLKNLRTLVISGNDSSSSPFTSLTNTRLIEQETDVQEVEEKIEKFIKKKKS